MPALTADRNTPKQAAAQIAAPVATNVKIFAGSLVAANAAGFATPGAVATTLTALGRAAETVDNTGGANGAKTVRIDRKEAFKFGNHAADLVVQADLGKTCFIVDDQTVAKTNGGATRSAAGKVVGIDADGVWVEIA